MRKIIYSLISVCLLVLTSCAKGDGDLDYGLMKVYMPQAMAGGGIDNYYNVPSGGETDTYNYQVGAETIDIFLGVMRSGKAAGEGFSVDVLVNETSSSEVAKTLGATVMPESLYTLPGNVQVESGKNSQTFFLSLDKVQLKAQAGKKLVLCVGLVNPSRYELSEKASEVAVVVDVDALKL